jgi:uncharacterized membrane protein YsdA (DUF1294 family)/cold shock CspA family protein
MRTAGKITHWNNEKGYGFITPSSGAKQVFVHVRAFSDRNHQPAADQMVTFALSSDKQGRPCAARVVLAGAKAPERIRRNDGVLMVAGALLFLVIVCLSVLAGPVPAIILAVYLGLSIVTYLIYYFDKSAARSGGQRTPESTLHSLSVLGGWPGALIAQQTLRHKSSKESFRAVFWITVFLNCCVFLWMFTSSGSSFLAGLMAG